MNAIRSRAERQRQTNQEKDSRNARSQEGGTRDSMAAGNPESATVLYAAVKPAGSQFNIHSKSKSNSRLNLKKQWQHTDATASPAGPVSGGAYQSSADVRRLAEDGQLELNGKFTVS